MTLLASLRDWLKAQQLDAVLLSSRQNKQPHLGISTGSGYVVISRESAHILVDSRYYADVEARTQGYQLHLLDAMHTLATIVRQIIADEQLQTLGFEGQQVSWETAHRWQSELNAKLVSATPDVLRQIKTPEEVEKIRLACGIADRGAEHIRRFIQAGMSECEIAAELSGLCASRAQKKPLLTPLSPAAGVGRCRTAKPATRLLQRASLSLSISVRCIRATALI